MIKILNKRDLWHALSKQSTNFDNTDNDRIWDEIKPNFTFVSTIQHACGSS